MDKNTKILILGAKGMLGHDLAKVFTYYDLTLWGREELDITNENQLQNKIKELNPKIIINSAACTGVDNCETNKEMTMAVNGYAVGCLAKIAKMIGATLVQISTDYVFDGQRKEGYTEDWQDFGPLNVYGQSKLLGEELVKKNTDRYYIIRTSLLFGLYGYNFPQTMLKLGQEREELKVVDDQICNPTYTVDLAKQILYILNNNLIFGIYHATNETENIGISRYEFVKKLFELVGLKTKVFPCKSKEFDLPAQRPVYSTLLNTKLPKMRNWQKALAEYIENYKRFLRSGF